MRRTRQGEGNGTHSSVLAWRIPGTEEPGGLPPMGSHRVGHDWSDLAAAAAAGSSVHGVPQARILEWVAISFKPNKHFKKLTNEMTSGALKGSDIFLVIWKVNFTPRTRKDPSLFHLTDFKFLCKYEMKAQSITNCLGFEDVPSQHTGPLGKD